MPWLSGITTDEMEQLQPKFVMCRFEPGDTVFSQGDAADKWYVLLQGTLLVTVGSDASSERELCRLPSPSRPTNATHLNQPTHPNSATHSNLQALCHSLIRPLPPLRLNAIAAFGERGILWDCPRTSNVSAVDTCICAALTQATFLSALPSHALLLLQTALPPPGSGDAPPMLTGESKAYKLNDLSSLGVLGKGSYGTVRLVKLQP